VSKAARLAAMGRVHLVRLLRKHRMLASQREGTR
jgi:hypothetical protein